MFGKLHRAVRLPIAVAIGLAAVAIGTGPAAGTHSTVTAVTGSAFGYHADQMAFAGNPEADTGPTPTVTLAPDASNSTQRPRPPPG